MGGSCIPGVACLPRYTFLSIGQRALRSFVISWLESEPHFSCGCPPIHPIKPADHIIPARRKHTQAQDDRTLCRCARLDLPAPRHGSSFRQRPGSAQPARSPEPTSGPVPEPASGRPARCGCPRAAREHLRFRFRGGYGRCQHYLGSGRLCALALATFLRRLDSGVLFRGLPPIGGTPRCWLRLLGRFAYFPGFPHVGFTANIHHTSTDLG